MKRQFWGIFSAHSPFSTRRNFRINDLSGGPKGNLEVCKGIFTGADSGLPFLEDSMAKVSISPGCCSEAFGETGVMSLVMSLTCTDVSAKS